MMRYLIFLLLLSLSFQMPAQEPVPFRADSLYDFEMDYNFKTKPSPPVNHISLTQTTSSAVQVLPYVKVKIRLHQIMDNDYKVKVVNHLGHSVLSKRLRKPMDIEIDMGFAEDIKDRIVSHIYYVYFMNKKKDIHDQVMMEVSEDGDFFLNGEVYGKL